MCFYQTPHRPLQPSFLQGKTPAGQISAHPFPCLGPVTTSIRHRWGQPPRPTLASWPTGFPFRNIPSANVFLLSEAAVLYLHTLLFVLRPVISLNGFVTQAAKRWAVRLHNEEQAFNYSSSLRGGEGGTCWTLLPLEFKGQGTEVFHMHAWNFNHLPLGLSKSCPPALHSEENGKRAGVLATSFNLAVLFSKHGICKQLQTPSE